MEDTVPLWIVSRILILLGCVLTALIALAWWMFRRMQGNIDAINASMVMLTNEVNKLGSRNDMSAFIAVSEERERNLDFWRRSMEQRIDSHIKAMATWRHDKYWPTMSEMQVLVNRLEEQVKNLDKHRGRSRE